MIDQDQPKCNRMFMRWIWNSSQMGKTNWRQVVEIAMGRVFNLKKHEEMREAFGLRPLERRFRADENSWNTDGFRAFQKRR
jgi:hypothetical protein